MMKFTFDIENPQQQYILITAEINVSKNETKVFLPAWRPGRYELGDFAKNVNHFQITDENGAKLNFQKQNKNTWLVQTENCSKIFVKYSYYAAELNSGSTFLDANQLYVNPVNCCVFTDEQYNQPITVKLNIPKQWEIAHSLKVTDRIFTAANFDELADNPFICSAQLQKRTYEVENTTFYIWFNGIVKPDWDRLIDDFKKFTKTQIVSFSKFPTNEYHFLFQIVPYKAYHGVEHSKSTVITLGPSYAVFEDFYTELLGVSSHELYHTWNVKSIRPKNWMPYNLKGESYSELGYIAEGITTYMGDLMLYKSGAFSFEQYLIEMNKQLQKHLDNFGRFNYSVAASSFDTWLDGYVPGAPARKISIYTEGCLLAFIIDVLLLKNTANKNNLDGVMHSLYHNFGDNGKGVTEKDYQKKLEKLTGTSMQWFFDDYVHGTKEYLPLLEECFGHLGLKLKNEPSSSEFATYLGAKIDQINNETILRTFYPNGSLDKAGAMIGDKVLAINGVVINNDAENWAKYFRNDPKKITLNRNGQMIEISVPASSETYFKRHFLEIIENPSKEQIQIFDRWSGRE